MILLLYIYLDSHNSRWSLLLRAPIDSIACSNLLLRTSYVLPIRLGRPNKMTVPVAWTISNRHQPNRLFDHHASCMQRARSVCLVNNWLQAHGHGGMDQLTRVRKLRTAAILPKVRCLRSRATYICTAAYAFRRETFFFIWQHSTRPWDRHYYYYYLTKKRTEEAGVARQWSDPLVTQLMPRSRARL